jgi:hypothetical protein
VNGRADEVTGRRVAAPRYGGRSVAELVPAITDAVTGSGSRLLPLPDGVRAVVLLVIDGMGRRNLDAHAALAPTLSDAVGPTLDAPFPSTTSVSLTSIGTGRPPGQHGLTSYSVAVPGDDRPLICLTWTWGLQVGGDDARRDVPPETFQPTSTAFARATDRGVRAVTVLRPEFTTSGLTRAGLRGGETVAATGLGDTLTAALDACGGHGDPPTVVYAHHPDLDALGHWYGPGSEEWCAELGRIDAALARTREQLPADVALVVTADHGMVHVPDEGFVELADAPELLAGVRVLTGDGRARQLHVADGAVDDVLATWRSQVGHDGFVVTRDQAIDAGWFGPVDRPEVRARIGDVLVVADGPVAWVHRDADLFGGRLPGLHAGLTRTELEVPALVVTR